LGTTVNQVLYTHGALWVLTDRWLLRIDSSSGAVTRSLLPNLGRGRHAVSMALAGSQIWLVCFAKDPQNDALARVPIANPRFGVADVVLTPYASAVAGTTRSMWVTTSADPPAVTELDPRTGRPVGTPFDLPSPTTWAVAVGAHLWLIGYQPDTGDRRLLQLASG
jgi:hypothetical protein